MSWLVNYMIILFLLNLKICHLTIYAFLISVLNVLAQDVPLKCIHGYILPRDGQSRICMKTGGANELLGSYHIDEEEEPYYFKFTEGWSEFAVQSRMQIDDLIVIQVKVTRDYIRLIVEVVSDNSDDNVEAQEDDGGSELGSVVGENF